MSHHLTGTRGPGTVHATFHHAGHSHEIARRLERSTLTALGIRLYDAPREASYTWLQTQRSLDQIGAALLHALDIETQPTALTSGAAVAA